MGSLPENWEGDNFSTVDRRALLHRLGATALATSTGGLFALQVWAQPTFSAYPFSLGVASGDPSPDGVVLWTKIAPKPLEHGGGMPMRPVEVGWAVATDAAMRQVVSKESAIAHPELGHSVHVEVSGLEPGRDYYYQFQVGAERSRVGRTRTLPAARSQVAQVRFAIAGCQKYEDGFYTAWRRLAEERFDFVYHYGDYIYERRVLRPAERALPVARVMPGDPDETFTLDDYRNRYSIYQLDQDLQAAHASAPFIMSFDDHEVSNDWADTWNERKAPPELFLLRRAAAFQAWYEHVPVRKALLPRGPDIQMYRRFTVGNLLEVNVLDTRQFRSAQACGGGIKVGCAEALEPQRTMMGSVQEKWLYDSFKNPSARWTALAQQVILMRNDRSPDPDVFMPSVDKWDGAVAARARLFSAIEEAKVQNLVSLAGDIHNNWAGELKKDFLNEKSPTLGIEFVGTSISTDGDGYDINENFRRRVAKQPYVKFFNNQRGYLRHTVTPARWQAEFQVLDKVTVPDGRMSTRKSLVVESGKPAIVEG
jgi:alkaline phosphatase D